MSTTLFVYTVLHVAVSLVGIASGFVVLYDLLRSRVSPRLTKFFLATTILTSVSGFGFPFHGVTPGHVLGVLSLAALALAVYAMYSRHLVGRWRTAYVVAAFVAQYFNFFVLIVQSFQKVPALHALAPTQTESPFAVTQLLTLVGFAVWARWPRGGLPRAVPVAKARWLHKPGMIHRSFSFPWSPRCRSLTLHRGFFLRPRQRKFRQTL
ncbi:MAG: hypothetical protein QM775_35845 [Pirellulales bacterium]